MDLVWRRIIIFLYQECKCAKYYLIQHLKKTNKKTRKNNVFSYIIVVSEV